MSSKRLSQNQICHFEFGVTSFNWVYKPYHTVYRSTSNVKKEQYFPKTKGKTHPKESGWGQFEKFGKPVGCWRLTRAEPPTLCKFSTKVKWWNIISNDPFHVIIREYGKNQDLKGKNRLSKWAKQRNPVYFRFGLDNRKEEGSDKKREVLRSNFLWEKKRNYSFKKSSPFLRA